ncbi:prostatic acid phosphatase-like [Diaphorina citri]|uniref:acid phosphatase n=1 Tax=Diaphorina citri TaxID=121845 RepID=A0A3Q0JJ05_DIACI|nr:prostatic acid phosphatase-like [Diaphorina citri]
MRAMLILFYVLPLLVGRKACEAPECNEIDEYAQSSVVFTAVIFRHGDRAPEKQEVYACDPYKSEERYWPEGFGNLLKRGRQRLYTLGKFLRNRYSSLLPETYHFHDVNITSSDLDRTISSALCLLGGLYLPQSYDEDPSCDIVAPIIPVHSINMNNDMWIMFKKDCPKYAAELDNMRLEKYNETLALGMSFVYTYLTKYTCQRIASVTDVNRVHTALLTQKEHGYPPPEWATGPQYPQQQIEYIGALSFYARAYDHVQKRLAGGPLVTKIIDSMVAKRNRSLEPDYKMLLFSGHDTTVGIMLQTLGYDKLVKPDFGSSILSTTRENSINTVLLYLSGHDTTVGIMLQTLGYDKLVKPDFGSSILFELHSIHNQYYVKVFFKPSGFSNHMIPLQFPNCHLPTICTLDEFIAVNQPWRISLEEWQQECAI